MADAEKTIKEILDRRREFVITIEGSEPEHYFIADPSGEDIRKSDWQYSKVFNQALADGFPTQAQMIDTLKQRGILSEEYEKEVEQTRIALAAALFRLEHLTEGVSDEEKEELAMEVAQARDKLFQLNQRVNAPLANCCENLAADARTEFLTSRLIQRKDGTKIWPDFDSYRKDENITLTTKARFEVMLWLEGLDSNYLENTPEKQALREIGQRRLEETIKKISEGAEKAMESSQADDAPEELSIDEVEAAPKPKRKGRPKKGSKTVSK